MHGLLLELSRLDLRRENAYQEAMAESRQLFRIFYMAVAVTLAAPPDKHWKLSPNGPNARRESGVARKAPEMSQKTHFSANDLLANKNLILGQLPGRTVFLAIYFPKWRSGFWEISW